MGAQRRESSAAAACVLLAVFAALLVCSLAQAEIQHRTTEEAWRVGVAFVSTRNYATSREPLEATVQMAPDYGKQGRISLSCGKPAGWI